MTAEDGVGKRIKDCREAKKISQATLAKLVGLSTAAIWNWETKGTVPRPETLSKVADALGVSENYLFDGGDRLASSIVSSKPTESLRAPLIRALVRPSMDTVAEEVERVKAKIAELTGFDISQVRLRLEFVD
jgi:transcriptional regulator with XRE-family HTH domain